MNLQIHPNVNRVFKLDQGVAWLFGYEVIEASNGSFCIKARVSNEFVNAAGFGVWSWKSCFHSNGYGKHLRFSIDRVNGCNGQCKFYLCEVRLGGR